jgi:hypothetical protein
MLSVIMPSVTFYYYVECQYAVCHYGECHYTECHGAMITSQAALNNTSILHRLLKSLVSNYCQGEFKPKLKNP